MSSSHSRGSTKVVEEDIPCMDSGSWLKLYYNTFFKEPFNNVKVVDNVPISVVCSDAYCGKESKQRVTESSRKLHYFSYRNRFSRLPNGTSTDTRWGCLARTGQMLLATALLRARCGAGHTIASEQAESIKSSFRAAFMDRPDAPLGLHQIEEEAHRDGAAYATWLSPTQLAVVLTGVVEAYRVQGGDVPHAVCGKDRDINVPQIEAILDAGSTAVLFIPLALGIDVIGDKYQEPFFKLLDAPTSCGIAGGVKKGSYYFFGHQERKLMYFDPHYVQRAYRSTSSLGEARSAFKMTTIDRLSPFMLTGFYIDSRENLQALVALVEDINKGFPFPLISITRSATTNRVATPNGPPPVEPTPMRVSPPVTNPLSPAAA